MQRQNLKRKVKKEYVAQPIVKKSKGGIINTRFDHAVTTPKGSDFKTAALVRRDIFSKGQQEEIQKAYAGFPEPELGRKIATVLYDKDTPSAVLTAEKKTMLHRMAESSGSSLVTFSNAGHEKRNLLADFDSEAEIENKPLTIRVTAKILADAAVENAQLKGLRKPSQRTVKGMGANTHGEALVADYLEETGDALFPDDFFADHNHLFFEWLHKFAHSLWGNKKAQIPDNMFVGSKFCNSIIMLFERRIPNLTKDFPDGFDLSIVVKYKKEIPSKVTYTISDKKIPTPIIFSYDPLETRKPHIGQEEHYKNFFTAVGLVLGTSDPKKDGVLKKRDRLGLLFFDKPKPATLAVGSDKENATRSKKKTPQKPPVGSSDRVLRPRIPKK